MSEQEEQNNPGAQAENIPGGGLSEAAGTGVFAGAAAGLAAHYLSGGKLTFPIFIVAYVLLLGHLKGWGKLVGLLAFTIVAALIVYVFQYLK